MSFRRNGVTEKSLISFKKISPFGDCVAMLNMCICHSERSEESNECNMLKNKILRLKPQNDIATHSRGRNDTPLKLCQ